MKGDSGLSTQPGRDTLVGQIESFDQAFQRLPQPAFAEDNQTRRAGCASDPNKGSDVVSRSLFVSTAGTAREYDRGAFAIHPRMVGRLRHHEHRAPP